MSWNLAALGRRESQSNLLHRCILVAAFAPRLILVERYRRSLYSCSGLSRFRLLLLRSVPAYLSRFLRTNRRGPRVTAGVGLWRVPSQKPQARAATARASLSRTIPIPTS